MGNYRNRKHFGCIVSGCLGKHQSLGLCKLHYIRSREQGPDFDRSLLKEGDPRGIPERIERFSMPIPESGCIIWTSTLNSYGYALMEIKGQPKAVHRLVFEMKNGPIPKGVFICHTCDVRCCININHLYAGSPADNAHDRDKRGRANTPKGETCGYNKLTEKNVRDIKSSSLTNQELGDKYGVSRAAIRLIRAGKNWKHVI